MKEERLLDAIGHIDDDYIAEAGAGEKRFFTKRKIVALAASFVVIIALSLYLFIPFRPQTVKLSAYKNSEYFPLIEKIADYNYTPPRYKNNFQYILSRLENMAPTKDMAIGGGSNNMNSAPGDASPENSIGAPNGNYVENTDNQVSGVIEADIVKMTDKYLFRLNNSGLTVYTLAGDESKKLTSIEIPKFADEQYNYMGDMEMYLSRDASTITIIKPYQNKSRNGKVGIISIDLSDINSIAPKAKISIDGSYNSSRMVDGKLLLISEYYFSPKTVDYANPETYVPTIDRGDGTECIRFEDIILPDSMSNTRYSVVSLISEGDLELISANALLNFIENIYVSENNVFITREYTNREDIDEKTYRTSTMSDIAILGYSGNKLEQKGIITVSGTVKNQYSLDEHEGYLRLVTTTNINTITDYSRGDNDYAVMAPVSNTPNTKVNLYVFNLGDNSLTAKVEDFAPEGETAESVRFEGDTAYVCTAVVITFTDPVFFFDLSDYDNITYTDTGVIDGYSTSLINFGNGFLLGIGQNNMTYNKVEVYEERDGAVVSVDSYLFDGSYYREYKSYLIDRENQLFGFNVSYISDGSSGRYFSGFILLSFDGYRLTEILRVPMYEYGGDRTRAVYHSGYIYLTNDNQFKFVKLDFAD